MSELLTLNVDEVGAHPKNVRREVIEDAEMVASVKAQGILQPLVVVDAPEAAGTRFWLIVGHRRLAAAKAAGLATVPAIHRTDLVSEAAQIEAMLVENGQRQDLTPVEEADAYQQLDLLGVEVAEMARATGRSKKTVTSRLRLAGDPTVVKSAVHDGSMTLGQADALAGLEEDLEVYSWVVEAVGTPDLDWRLRSGAERLGRKRERAALVAAFEADGVPLIVEPEGGFVGSWLAPCDRWVQTRPVDGGVFGVDFDGYTLRGFGPVMWVISPELQATQAEQEPAAADPAEAARKAEEFAQREAEHAEWAEMLKRHGAAREVRFESIRRLFSAVKFTEPERALLNSAAIELFYYDRKTLIDQFGLEHDGNSWSVTKKQIAEWVEKQSNQTLMAALVTVGVRDLDDGYEPGDHDSPGLAFDYLTTFKQVPGHPWSTPDQEWLDVLVADLDAEAGA